MWRSSSRRSTVAAALVLVSICMPAAWPARLPETFLGGGLGASEPLQRFARAPLVEQLAGSGEALGRAAHGVGGGATIALGEQQFGAGLGHGCRPRAAAPASRAV